MGEMTADMDTAIKSLIAGKHIWDLGAGSLDYAKHLLSLGASEVTAVDKEGFSPSAYHGRNITPVGKYFSDIEVPPAGIQVAWLSWPLNRALYGLLPLLEASETVIYLGSNTNGTACGWPALFEHLLFREVLAHVPHRRNSLIVYGEERLERRFLLGEELAAFSPQQILDFDEAQMQANLVAYRKDCPFGDSPRSGVMGLFAAGENIRDERAAKLAGTTYEARGLAE